MRSRFPPFSLLRAVLCVLCASLARTFCVGNAQIVTEFDTSTGGFQITCDPTQLPALCAYDESYSKYSFTTDGGSFSGVVKFSQSWHKFAAENCEQESCSFFCDDVCSCVTGTIESPGGGFQPDGGSCTIVSSNPGTVPTSEPTEMPTAPPTFDPTTAILYNATEMIEPAVLRVRCGGFMPIQDSYCKLVSGVTRFSISDIDTYGWSNCDQNGDDCVVSCSPDCTCEVTSLGEGGGFNDTAPALPCEIVEPTPAPTAMPTEAPSEDRPPSTSSAVSVGICRVTHMLMSIGLITSFLVGCSLD